MKPKDYIENQSSINAWQRRTFPDATFEGEIKHLEEEFREFLDSVNIGEALEEAADIVILLYAWAGRNGLDLHQEIDRKMRVNRLRSWTIQPDGTGRHK